jgi:hypothetical protein
MVNERKMEGTEKKIFDEVLKFVREVKYGEVVIKIHDSRIVQIEKKVKERFSKLHEQV